MVLLIEEIWKAVRSRWRVALSALTACLMVTAGVILFYPRVYHSRAKLLVRVGRESVSLDPTANTAGGILQLHRTSEHEVNTTLSEMTSRALLEQVERELGNKVILNEDLGSQEVESGFLGSVISSLKGLVPRLDRITASEEAVIKLEKNIEIKATPNSSVIAIEYRGKSPHFAQRVLELWVDAYTRQHLRVTRTEGAYDFLLEQAEVLSRQLSEAREQLRRKKNEAGLVTINGQQDLLEARLSATRDQLTQTDTELAASSARKDALQRLIADAEERVVLTESTGPGDDIYEGMRQKLYDLEAERERLRSTRSENHPELVAITRQLTELRAILAAQSADRRTVVTGKNPITATLEQQELLERATYEALNTKRKSIAETLAALETDVNLLNQREQEIAELSRQVDILEHQYRTHAGRVEQARFDDALEARRLSNIAVVQPPTLEEKPVAPKKLLCVALGLFAGFSSAVGIPVLLQEYVPRRDPREARRSSPREHRAGSQTPDESYYVDGVQVIATTFER